MFHVNLPGCRCWYILPETNTQIAPENGWLEDSRAFSLGFGLFWGVNSLLVFGRVIATRSYEMLTQPKSQENKTCCEGNMATRPYFLKNLVFFCINKPSKQLMCKPRHLVKSYSHSSPSLIPNKSSNLLKHVIWFWVVFQIGLPQKLPCFCPQVGNFNQLATWFSAPNPEIRSLVARSMSLCRACKSSS